MEQVGLAHIDVDSTVPEASEAIMAEMLNTIERGHLPSPPRGGVCAPDRPPLVDHSPARRSQLECGKTAYE
eukprot:3869118-Prymnesium_polylepis.1